MSSLTKAVDVLLNEIGNLHEENRKLKATLQIYMDRASAHGDRWCGVSLGRELLAREIIRRAEKPGFRLNFKGLFDEHGRYIREDRGHGHNL